MPRRFAWRFSAPHEFDDGLSPALTEPPPRYAYVLAHTQAASAATRRLPLAPDFGPDTVTLASRLVGVSAIDPAREPVSLTVLPPREALLRFPAGARRTGRRSCPHEIAPRHGRLPGTSTLLRVVNRENPKADYTTHAPHRCRPRARPTVSDGRDRVRSGKWRPQLILETSRRCGR